MDNKFRAWDNKLNKYLELLLLHYNEDGIFGYDLAEGMEHIVRFKKEDVILEQYIGLKDKYNVQYFHNDIGEFDNGDRFIIERRDWLEFYIEWISVKCEDQGRDFYRIQNAKIIGNLQQNPELIR